MYRTDITTPKMLFDIWNGQRELPTFIKTIWNLYQSLQKDIIQWTKCLVMIPLWSICWFLDCITRPLDPLKWWLSLCYEAYENLHKPTYVTLRFSKKTFPSFDKRYCILSNYQVEGNSIWLGAPSSRGSNKMFKNTNVKYKNLHLSWPGSKISKNAHFPRKGFLITMILILFMIMCFIPPFMTAIFKINKVKLFGNKEKVALVNVRKVLNVNEEESSYFTNFDSDTKLAVVDNSANVHIWNCLQDFINFRPFTQENMPENVETIGAGALPEGCGDVPIILLDDNQVEHEIILRNVFFSPKSGVNIISVPEFATLFPDNWGQPDEEGTHIKSCRSRSTFTWNRGQFVKISFIETAKSQRCQ